MLAHRGLRRHGPENSLAGFRGVIEAASAGIPLGAELDVRRTADDQLIVVHDPFVMAPDPVSRTDRLFFADNWYSSAQLALGEACPPRLEDVMELLADSKVPCIDVDIKERGYTKAAVEIALAHAPGRVMLSSHIPEVIMEIRALAPESVPLGMAVSQYWHFDEDRLIHLLDDVAASFLFLHQRHITKPFVDKLHEAGKQIGAYTVNDKPALHRFIDMGVDFPCTDFPEMAITELETLVIADEIVLNAEARQTA